jgi:hypothetical protein
MKPSVLVAAGCSWVFGKNVDAESTFAYALQQQLGLDKCCVIAENGSNNYTQLHRVIEFIKDNRNSYSQIFVLWGLTSIYRWEMYSATTNQIEPCMLGRSLPNTDSDDELKYYFAHFFNTEYELTKLGDQITLLNGYLKSLDVGHLIFNSFQGYNSKDLNIDIDSKYFYQVEEKNNDMLSFLCENNNIKISSTKVPWLNLARDSSNSQFNNSSIKELQSAGMLDSLDAHPTIEAHKLIANKLYDYIKEKNNERI